MRAAFLIMFAVTFVLSWGMIYEPLARKFGWPGAKSPRSAGADPIELASHGFTPVEESEPYPYPEHEPESEPDPESAPDPDPAPDPEPMVVETDPKPSPDQFSAPVFDSLEKLVGNWQTIPANLFPQQIILKNRFEFRMEVGASVVPAGGTVSAISAEGDMLVIAPSPDSAIRGRIAMDETDFKTVIANHYESWKTRMTDRARQDWEKERNGGQQPIIASGAPPVTTLVPVQGGQGSSAPPERNSDGSYPALITSMAAGQVTQITPQNINNWGNPFLQQIDGREVWTVVVSYTARTMFGNKDTDATAILVDGKVDRWIYTSTGEPVP